MFVSFILLVWVLLEVRKLGNETNRYDWVTGKKPESQVTAEI